MENDKVIAIILELLGNKKAKASKPVGSELIGKWVIVRTLSAGVHFGQLSERRGQEVVLTSARRIWNWYGAKTLNEMSVAGVDATRSKIAQTIPYQLLTQAIEVIPCSAEAIANLQVAKWTA